MFQRNIVEKIKTKFCVKKYFFGKSGRLRDNVEK